MKSESITGGTASIMGKTISLLSPSLFGRRLEKSLIALRFCAYIQLNLGD